MQEQQQEEKITIKAGDEHSIEIVSAGAAGPSEIEFAQISEHGEKLGEKYEIISLIGSGGMSVVYKVKEKASGRYYAAKVLKNSLLCDETAKHRFQKETEYLQRLDHPNIIKVLGSALTEDGKPFLIMEWLDGTTLSDRIKIDGALPVHEALSIFAQMTHALEYAHSKGIIHRDIKPSNVLLNKSESGYTVKIMDFGIAKVLGETTENSHALDSYKTESGAVIGSPAYMSPEQCLGENVDARSDIYSMGCLMFEALIGTNPFIASTPISTILNHLEGDPELLLGQDKVIKLKVPPHIEQAMLKCLSKKADLRYQSAKELEIALFPPAGLFARILAPLLDCGLIGLFIWLGATVAPQVPEINEFFVMHDKVWIYWWALVFTTYYVGFETVLHATPGKFITGLRIANVGGQSPFSGNCARALSICGILSFLFAVPDRGYVEAIARSTGSNYDFFFMIHDWSYFVLFLYLLYFFAFVLLKKEQWHLDTFFGRSLVTSKVAKLLQRKTSSPVKTRWAPYAVTLVSLAVLIGMPVLSNAVFKRAWGDPAVVKDIVYYAREKIGKGTTLSENQLSVRPIMRSFGDCFTNPRNLVGKKSTCAIAPHRVIGLHDIDAPGNESPHLVFLALLAEQKGDLEDAHLNYLKAIRTNSQDKEAWEGLARILEKRGQRKQALSARARAQMCSSAKPEELARLLNNCDKAAEALAVTEYALKINPKDMGCLREMARALDILGASRSSENVRKRMQDLQP